MADATATPATTQRTLLEIRQMQTELEADALQQLAPLPESLCERMQNVTISADCNLEVKLIHPVEESSTPRPLIVLFYGGGFMAGSCHQLAEPGRTFATKLNAVVVLGSYRMIPEVRWPTTWKDGWNLLSYLSQHAHEANWGSAELSNQRGGGFVVGGISSGASIATVCAEIDALGLAEAKEGEGIAPLAAKITGLMANVPFLLVPETVPEKWLSEWTAWKDNENVEGFNTRSLGAVINHIQCTDYTSYWFSPMTQLLRSQHPLERHPRVYVSVCQFDPIRDDGKLFCQALKERGVETMLDLFPNDGHNGWTIRPVPRKSTNPTIEEANLRGMRWLLRQ